MRVVWITHNYPRYAGDVAGAFLHPVAIELRRVGVDVRVVAPSDAGRGGADALDGVPVMRVRYGTAAAEHLAYRGTMARATRSPRGLMAFNRLRSALEAGAREQLRGDATALVHAHWWIPAGLAAPRPARLVLTCHGTDVRLLEKSALLRWFARPVFRRARVVTTVSHSLASSISQRMGIAVSADAIQPMAVPDVARPTSDRSGNVVVVGRLTEQKRVDLALEAMAIARSEGLQRMLTVAGDGPARAGLERRAEALGIADLVTFVGEVAPDAIPAVFASASCCLVTARGEGFGLVAAEALMQGVPVVCCEDGGGVREIVSAPGAGSVVPPGPQSIARAIAALVADPDAGPAAFAAGSQWRGSLAPAAVAARFLGWYDRASHA